MSKHDNVALSIQAERAEDGTWTANYFSTDGKWQGGVLGVHHRSNVVKECIHGLSEQSSIPRSRVRIKEVNYQ